MAQQVAILMGSDSDWPVMQACARQLAELGIECRVEIVSAHRTPERVREFALSAREAGIQVIIAAAGLAAALAGSLAAHTTLPVIGVPIASGPLRGVDALLSTVQMPPGVPVAAVGIGAVGARNAALLAAEILAVSDGAMASRLEKFKSQMAGTVDKKNQALREQLLRGEKAVSGQDDPVGGWS